jgi:serine 3-dehydrogenase (NADP+)
MELRDRVAVVTGASAGIGEAIAKELSSTGVKLVLTARRGDRLEAMARELPGPAQILAGDIADPDMAERLLRLAVERFGRADILINNAGMLVVGTVDTIDVDAAAQMVRVNYEAVVRTCYVFGRAFKAQQSGAIINFSSIGAFNNSSMNAVYGGLKAGLERFTDGLRVELGRFGVKVGTLAPGGTRTEMLDHLLSARGARADIPALAPADIAAAVRFMLERPDHVNIPAIRVYPSDSSS